MKHDSKITNEQSRIDQADSTLSDENIAKLLSGGFQDELIAAMESQYMAFAPTLRDGKGKFSRSQQLGRVAYEFGPGAPIKIANYIGHVFRNVRTPLLLAPLVLTGGLFYGVYSFIKAIGIALKSAVIVGDMEFIPKAEYIARLRGE